MGKYFRIWVKMTSNSVQTNLSSRVGFFVFSFGKIFRFVLTVGFVYFLLSGTKTIASFSKYEVLLFLLTFTLLGSIGQMFFRETYRFRSRIVSGDFDFDLLKPIHPVFRNLFGGFDILDLMTMPLFVISLLMVLQNLTYSTVSLLTYCLLSINSLIIIGSIHIVILSLGVMKTEVDNAVMVYRDVETMGRFPVDIYKQPLREVLTFVIPVGIMFTIPVKALLGIVSFSWVLVALVVGIASLILSMWFWNYALKRYTSASS